MALGDSISASGAYDNFNSQRLPGATNASGTAMTNVLGTPGVGTSANGTDLSQFLHYKAIDGLVPGVTWDQLTGANYTGTQASAYDPNNFANVAFATGDVAGLGGVGRNNTGLGQIGGEGGSAGTTMGPTAYEYKQDVGDGTYNYFVQNPNGDGSVISKNQSYEPGSFIFDKLLPGLIQAGVLGGAGVALAPVAAGALGYGGDAAAAGTSADIGSTAYNPWSPANWSASASTTATDAAASTAAQSAAPTFLDQAGNYLNQLGTQWGQLNPLLRTGLGSLASSAVSGLSGSGGSDSGSTNPYSSIVQSYTGGNDPAGLAALDSQSVSSSGATPGLFDSYGSTPWYQSLLGKSGSNPVTSFANILSGNGQGADYSNALTSALGLGSSIYNGVAGSNAARTAAGQQTSAINSANALTAAIYGDTVNRNAPFVAAGTGAVNKMADLNGLNGAVNQGTAAQNFVTSDPGFQFRMDQGNRAVQASAAGQGGLYSGRAFKDAQTYAQGLGSQEYSNAYGRLSGLATLGQNSANNTGLLGANYGNTASNLLTAGGIAQSAGTMGSTNAITNALSQLLKNQAQNGYYGT